MQKFVFTALSLILFSLDFELYAQQNPDPVQWKADFVKKVEKQLTKRREQLTRLDEELKATEPDFVVFVPKADLDTLGDCYNDHFQVIQTSDGSLLGFDFQATVEGYLDMHVASYKSTDGGHTWSPPRVVAGPATIHSGLPPATCAFPMLSKSGRVYLLYMQFVPGKVNINRQHTGIMMGMYSDDQGETWSSPQQVPMPRSCYDSPDETIPSDWVVWQKPLRLGENGQYFVGVTRFVAPKFQDKFITVSEFIQFENIDDDPEPANIQATWLSTNEDALHEGKICEEPSIVRLPDGRLFALMRTGSKYPFWSVSSDHGHHWSKPEPLRDRDGGKPFLHPPAPCPIYSWSENGEETGLYFTFINNVESHIRGPLFLLAGKYQPDAHQPIWFAAPQLFANRPEGQAFYSSTTIIDGRMILWYPDAKCFLLGRYIDKKWFQSLEEQQP